MDLYIVWLLAATVAGWIGLWITKPSGVPFNQLPHVKISLIANILRFATLITLSLLMIMVFVGMGLQRYQEFQQP